ncbi:MAG: RHS repeat-associated core domain-containing protein, partial [Thermoanaerobaculia bacterium]
RRDFKPFGEQIAADPTSEMTAPLRFASMERDVASTGLDYDHARYHAAPVGRFLSVDRSGGDLLDPQSLNGYTYALNNPLKYNDPNGRIPALAVAVALGAGVIEGGFRAADFALSRSNATTGDYIREFGIGFAGGVSAATAGILTALGTGNPFIIGAAAGEADALATQGLEVVAGERSSVDAIDVAIKTGAAAILGKTTEVLVPRLPGRVPHYFRNRSFGDLFGRPNVNRELRQGLTGAFLGSRGFAGIDVLRGASGPSGVYGPGYLNFQLFLYQYNTEVARSGSVPGGSVTICSSFSLSPGGASPCPR